VTPFPSLSEIQNSRLRNSIFCAGSLLGAAALAVVYHWNPESAGFFPACPIRALTGYYCPGCGSTRALHQLLHGNIAAAFSYNPLFVLAMPLVAYWIITEVILLFGGRLPRITVPVKVMWLALGVVIAFGVLRNIPHYPFTLLTP